MKNKMTENRLEVMRLTATGMTEKEVAEALGVNAVTVNRRMTEIYKHYGVGNRVRAVLCYLKSTGALSSHHKISGVPND